MRKLVGLLLLLGLGSSALADDWVKTGKTVKKTERKKQTDAEGPGQPPYSVADLQKLYVPGLELRYARQIQTAGKKESFLVVQEVVRAGSKGYLLQTLTFDKRGNCVEKAPRPQAIPYAVLPEIFSKATRWSKDAQVMTGAGLMQAIQYSYKVDVKGQPAWRNVWYSKKHPGLLLRTMLQPTGKVGQKNSVSLTLTALPAALGGKRLAGSPQGNLPWTDEAIMKAWAPGSLASYVTSVSRGGGKQELLVRQTMVNHSNYCYVMHQQVVEKASGKPLQSEAARPKLWGNFLAKIRWASPETLTKGELKEVEAAGKTWRCHEYTLEDAGVTLTFLLAVDTPGLTVRYSAKGPKGGVTRVLSEWRVGPAKKN